ncbi:MAG: hypothetical protein AAF203_10460 [Pseudomonadota bacterium]
MRFYFISFLLAFSFLLSSPTAKAYDFYRKAQIKQQQKDAKRWSLSQWLEQKKNSQLMDTWLMFNAPSPYEFFFSLDTSSFEQKTTISGLESQQSFRNYRAAFGAFVTIAGLYAEYETSDEELEQWKALFMFRLIGSSDQSTNLTLHYGLMNQEYDGTDPTQHQVAGVRSTFYLLKALALTGQYEMIFKATSEQGNEIEGSRVEAGAHIEYGALRFYGSWYQEDMDRVISGVEQKQIREGILFGTRIYF